MRGSILLTTGILLLGLPGICHAGIGPELNGLASFGASAGIMRWFADKDAAKYNGHAAQMRPIGKAVFKYRVNPTWGVSVETGFGWNSYGGSGDLVTWVIPNTIGLERHIGEAWGASTSLNFGAGAYVWGRILDGDFMRDPESWKVLHAVEPGVYVGTGGEFHASDHVTCSIQTTLHFMLSLHKNDFPAELGGNDLFGDVRFGVNYYFSPYEGLIWKHSPGK